MLMSRWRWQPAGARPGTVVLIPLVALACLAGTASAGPPDAGQSRFALDLDLDLAWAAALALPAAEPPDALPLVNLADEPEQLFSQAAPAPGLQFSLNPDDEGLIVGWQFEF